MGTHEKRDDAPEVAALRKRIRGEVLTTDEELLLARVSRRPPPGTVTFSQAQVMALLEERERRGD